LGPVLASAAPDLTVRWREGERLDQLFEDQCDRLLEQGRGGHLAVDADGIVLTYSDLDRRANQLARHLLGCGARPGDRIALLFDQPSSAYTAMLAVLKIGAAYVPLDPGFPPDRLKYIVEDADVAVVLSLSHLKDLLAEVAALTICLDHVRAHENPDRLDQALIGGTKDELAYIIYTSGSAGSPKGVAIEHASICNFVRVASDLYGIESTDRVYQGMTIAFDFSVEEIWVSWLAGATLVPKPGDPSLLGIELASYLVEKRITALCCVPTLLATIDEDLPGLRFLLVSGDLLPQGASVYGPADRRRRHRHSQELCLSLLPCPLGRHRDGPRDFGKKCACLGENHSRHRYFNGRRRRAGTRLVIADIAICARGTGLARFPSSRDQHGIPAGHRDEMQHTKESNLQPPAAGRAPCPGCSGRCSLTDCAAAWLLEYRGHAAE
jgi:hypothetical protein